MTEPQPHTEAIEGLVDDRLRPAVRAYEADRQRRYRIVAVYAVVSLVVVLAASAYVTFDIIGGDDALLAFIPTLAFLGGIGVLITVFAYFVHVKMPLQKRFRAQLLAPIVEQITPEYRDESAQELQRDDWRESGLFPDDTHQTKSEHLMAARVVETITVGFCHLGLDAHLVDPASRKDHTSSTGLDVASSSGFDGLFMVAKPATSGDEITLLVPRSGGDEETLPDELSVSFPSSSDTSLPRIDDLVADFAERFALYTTDASRQPPLALSPEKQREFVELHRRYGGQIHRFVLSLRDGKCHIAIPGAYPALPLRPRSDRLDDDTLVAFAASVAFAACAASVLN